MLRAGWGSLGGSGAREREQVRLGNTRGTVVLVRTFIWSGRQRGGVDFEVLDPVLCPEHGQGRGLWLTPAAARWGRVVVWVWLPAWRVVERDGREKGRYARSLHALGLGFPPPPPFLSIFSSKAWLGWC
jgi:hypothetical protein